MALSDSQNYFVTTYIIKGTRAVPDGAGNGADLKGAAAEGRKIWIDAKDDVDAAIEKLVGRLSREDDLELTDIADAIRTQAAGGLPGVSGGAQTKLLSGLMDLENGGDGAKVVPKTREAIDSYRSSLETSEFVALCEDNPFGVQIPIRAIMNGALDRIDKLLA